MTFVLGLPPARPARDGDLRDPQPALAAGGRQEGEAPGGGGKGEGGQAEGHKGTNSSSIFI